MAAQPERGLSNVSEEDSITVTNLSTSETTRKDETDTSPTTPAIT